MTTSSLKFRCARTALRVNLLAPALALCGMAFGASAARADALTFTVDSTKSYITLNIPNFLYSGNTINLTGQNRTNGAPISTAWSASTNTGNTAFVSGTIATTVGGSFTGQTLSAIQFIAGANTLTALNSGNYRPNPAAYNATTSNYDNNFSGPGNYASVAHVSLGNAGLVSFDNVTYDIGSNALLPTSNTVTTGTFAVNSGVTTGVASSTFSVQGLSLFLVGQLLPNDSAQLGSLLADNTAAANATYAYTSSTNLQINVPLSVPISIDVGGGVFINGTASGQFVANAAVPEPSTLALAGLAGLSLVAMVRRRRNKANVA